MTTPLRPIARTHPQLLAAAGRLLAARGAAARPDVLALAVAADPDLVSLVLRDSAGGRVVAQAGMPPAGAVGPLEPQAALEIPVRRGLRLLGVLTATAREPLTPAQAHGLHAVADLLALAYDDADRTRAAVQTVLDDEADRALLAAELDETVGAALVALRHVDPDQLPAAITAVAGAVRRLRSDLRATALHAGLAAALAELRAPGVSVDLPAVPLGPVAPAVAVLVERVAEAMVRNAVGPVHLAVRSVDGTVKLTVGSADNAIDASELERWSRRSNDLGGTLHRRPGGVELSLPADPRDERRDDHSPHL